MGRQDGSEVEARFARLRQKLDDGGYMESFGLDSLRLVEHIFSDLEKTTESLEKTLVEYSHYKKLADELECGVAPFKEENVGLLRENSQLRIALAKAFEEAEDKVRGPKLRLNDLEAENNDLKLLVSQLAEKVKKVEAESLEKTRRILLLQEKELGPGSAVVVKDTGRKLTGFNPRQKPVMELNALVGDPCQNCVRLRNFVEYGKNSDRNPTTMDYMKMADSRIEALQLQLRSLKNVEKEHLTLIASLKNRINTRESEIEKLRDLIKIRPGRDNKANAALSSFVNEKETCINELKSAELQLRVLQRRNIELEEKLKQSILQEHQDFMLGKTALLSDGNLARICLEKELDKYPSHDQMTLLEKMYYLERQLSHCCKEKAALKRKVDECECKMQEKPFEYVQHPTVARSASGAKPKKPSMECVSTLSSGRNGKPVKVTDCSSKPQRKTSGFLAMSELQNRRDEFKDKNDYGKDSELSELDDSEIEQLTEGNNGTNRFAEQDQSEDFSGSVDDSDWVPTAVNMHAKQKSINEPSQSSRSTKSSIRSVPTVSKNESSVMSNKKIVAPLVNRQLPKGGILKRKSKTSSVAFSNTASQAKSTSRSNRKSSIEIESDERTMSDGEDIVNPSYAGERAQHANGGHDEVEDYNQEEIFSSEEQDSRKRSNNSVAGKIAAGRAPINNMKDRKQPVGKPRFPIPKASTISKPVPTSKSHSGTSDRKPVQQQGSLPMHSKSNLAKSGVPSKVSSAQHKSVAPSKLPSRQTQREATGGVKSKGDTGSTFKGRGKLLVAKSKPGARSVPGPAAVKPAEDPDSTGDEDPDDDGAEGVSEAYDVYEEGGEEEGDYYDDQAIDNYEDEPEDNENSRNMDKARNSSLERKDTRKVPTGNHSNVSQWDSAMGPTTRRPTNGNTRKTVSEPSKKGIAGPAHGSVSSRQKSQKPHSDSERYVGDKSKFQTLSSVEEDAWDDSATGYYDDDDVEEIDNYHDEPVKSDQISSKPQQNIRSMPGREFSNRMDANVGRGRNENENGYSNAHMGRNGNQESRQAKNGTNGHSHNINNTMRQNDSHGPGENTNGTQGPSRNINNPIQQNVSQDPSRNINNAMRQNVSQGSEQTASGSQGPSRNIGNTRRPNTSQVPDQPTKAISSTSSSGRVTDHTDQRKPSQTGKRNDKARGISAIKEPSLLSISEFEIEEHQLDKTNMQRQSNNSVVTGGDRRRVPKAPGGSGDKLTSEEHQTLAAENIGPTNSLRSQYLRPPNGSYKNRGIEDTRNMGMPEESTDEQYYSSQTEQGMRNDAPMRDAKDLMDREFVRGIDDPSASYGDNSATLESQRGFDERNPYSRFMEREGSKEEYQRDQAKMRSSADTFKGQTSSSLDRRNQQQVVTLKSIGVNTEGRQTSWSEGPQDSIEKKSLLDKISSLQRKLDEMHTESSRHQLKSFEVQGELERTKHMLQIEKQEREIAVQELKRVRELNSESTARMLMNSALGSDSTFRRGTTPMELEREIINLRTALSNLDRDKDEMRVELDRKDERIARLTNESSRYVDELSQMKMRLKNAELQINHTGESAREQTREVEFLKKQLESNRRDLEKTIRERDEALKDLHKISGQHAKGQMDRRNVESELDLKSKEADDLRRQVQRYIDEVRRIEELLLDKEEEMETIIQHYRSLTVENNNLEAQRRSLETEASSIRESVRESVEQNISFKTQLASQNALVQSLEDEIQALTQQVSQLENQVLLKSEKERSLEADVKASKDLIYRLEVQMDKLKLDMADCDSKRKQLEAENSELQTHIGVLDARLHDETSRQQQLETLVADSREKDFQMERNTLGISRERDELAEKLTSLQQRSESLNAEVSRYRLKSIELQNELDRTRRQLDSEKRDRESAVAELRRTRDQLNTSSANQLLAAALGSSGTTAASGTLLSGNITDTSNFTSSPTSFRHNLGPDVRRSVSREPSPLASTAGGPSGGAGADISQPIAASTSRSDLDRPTESPYNSRGMDRMASGDNDTTDDYHDWESPVK